MTAILVSALVGLIVSLLGTPVLIRFLHRREYGQFIREDGPQGHFVKRGTPTMGGLVILASTVLGYAVANLVEWRSGIKVLDRAMLILVTIGEKPRSLTELCEATGLPRATAHRVWLSRLPARAWTSSSISRA